MSLRTSDPKTDFARLLRKETTDVERKLWSLLRNRQLIGLKFRRQQRIGPYIADFYCPRAKLVIELDGGHHLYQRVYDEGRTEFLVEKVIA